MSRNISREKRENLLEKIRKIRAFLDNANATVEMKAYLSELESELKRQKFGLVFEEHKEEIDETLEKNTPVLTEDKNLFINNGGTMNFLIEGDNLAALTLLEKTHKGKIDVIYIDPPYNTGREDDFIYDDKFVSEEDLFRHSKWLSFMKKRLEIAKKLLTQEGAIFIQISDIEVAQLKLLCDAIFGEDNFLNIINVNMKNIAGASGGGEDKKFKKNCEYILVYAKNYSCLPLFKGAYELTEISELIEQYKTNGISWKYTSVLLNDGDKIYLTSTVDGDGNEIKIYARRNAIIKSIKQLSIDEHISEADAYKKYGNKIFQTAMPQSSIRPRIMEKLIELGNRDDIVSIEYIPRSGRNKGKLYEQFYKGETRRLFVWLHDTSEEIDGLLYKKDLQGTYWNYASETKNLTKEGNVDFINGKKPIALIQRIVSLIPMPNITVLDFFAGSGSTGHAVIAQNNSDGGSRSFILCTNNENNICREKTYKRLANVINGYITEKGKVFSRNSASLKYQKIDYIPTAEQAYYDYANELLLHIKELVELENAVNFEGNADLAILLTEDEVEKFFADNDNFDIVKSIYLRSDISLTLEQNCHVIDNNIALNIIPQYYYKEQLI